MECEPRESFRAPLALAALTLGAAALAASVLVLASIELLPPEARDAARARAAGAVLLLLSLGAGAAVAGLGLARRERALARGERARARLARLGLLASGLADEVRAPLQDLHEQLVALRDLLEEEAPPWPGDSPAREPCDRALREVDRIDGLLRRFLAWARPEPSPPRILDVTALVREWARTLEPELSARGLALAGDGLDAPALAFADPDGLKHIFWSLVRNARDAAPGGSVVRIAVVRSADRVLVLVADRGPGIARERRDEVFEPFASTKPDGAGLGLAISRRHAEAMGATLAVTGGPPGAVLELSLRRAPATPLHLAPAAGERDRAA